MSFSRPRPHYSSHQVYWGRYYEEHTLGSTEQEQLNSLWESIGNQRSLFLTRQEYAPAPNLFALILSDSRPATGALQ